MDPNISLPKAKPFKLPVLRPDLDPAMDSATTAAVCSVHAAGARGLCGMCQCYLLKKMFEVPEDIEMAVVIIPSRRGVA